jgi:acetyltransferase-like isoleucine patch superfamily enzyme
VKIGNSCLFSTDITFRTGDSHSIINGHSGKRINPSKSIKIGNHVWFGHNSTILKGVVIQDNSIVAASSLVTKPFLDSGGIILGGNPAKIIKEDINWDRNRVSIDSGDV